MSEEEAKQEIEAFRQKIGALREEIARIIVGHREVVDGVLTCMLAGSHALLEGVPGLGKTMLVRTLADCVGLNFSRIQFTPDLMPADIDRHHRDRGEPSGKHVFEFRKGPIFANIVLADEINRATPKTQSALLEAMQEHRVTVGRQTYVIEEPFFVLATQNPLEMEGTYPLPEAQLDRFFFKLQVPFPSREELHAIIERTTTDYAATVEPVVSAEDILGMQKLVRTVPVARHVQDYAMRAAPGHAPRRTRTPRRRSGASSRVGASPRGAQAVLLAAKIRALFDGRFAASIDDVKASAAPALRHRMLLNFEGEAEGVKTDDCIREILDQLPEAKN